MFGNKYAAEELARNYQNAIKKMEVSKAQSSKKVAKASVKKAEYKAEDFLVDSSEKVDAHDEELTSRIKQVSSYAEDSEKEVLESCAKCGLAEHSAEDGCTSDSYKESDAEDISYLIDSNAQFILGRLGKIAREMKRSDKLMAADLIEASAIKIRDRALKEASTKLTAVNGLKKMAKASYLKGDVITGDVIMVTVNKITGKSK